MTRKGKIARLSHQVREKLNQRIRNGEQGKRLVEWLNSLPSVKKVLKREFGGEPINEPNLSAWKNGGYPDWQAHQQMLDDAQRMAAEAEEIGKKTREQLGERLAAWLMGRCAMSAARLARGEKPEDGEEAAFEKLCRNVVALRRGDHYARWIEIERERMESQKPSPQKLEKQFREWARDPKIQEEFFGKPRMTWEERDEAFRQVLGLPPREKEPGAAGGTASEAEEDESESEGDEPNAEAES